ncbi:glycosyl hydrolase family 10 protein [Thelonectria olida]|uniref:Beta-xylanase n=1 Tax=Thelonectria olida TaxID=1576542 RepID=A0A9P8VVR9_9HYPO|nr:glycosyl hydrolase family 10 protein [Thelonectria olida]
MYEGAVQCTVLERFVLFHFSFWFLVLSPCSDVTCGDHATVCPRRHDTLVLTTIYKAQSHVTHNGVQRRQRTSRQAETMKAMTLIIALLAAIEATDAVPSTGTTSLRKEAAKKDILIGSGAINPTYLDDPQFAAVLAEQFNSLSPENELKWTFIHPTIDKYNWKTIDRLVRFAKKNDMVVKGHGLIMSCCNPKYLLNITSPTAFRAAMTAHFEAVMHRYDGKVDRWDVVTEPLAAQGGGLQATAFYNVLGPGYIEDAFRIARAADPDAKLFLNENLVESIPGKRQELYDLVSQLLADGVPIDGIALQMHITEVAPIPGVLTEIVESYNALGLEVTISEMDVHTLNATLQADIYGSVIGEALEAGITDISFWGFTDKHAYTWLEGAKPLMFDEHYKAKGAFYATHTALKNFVSKP